MARVELTAAAVAELEELVEAHALPEDAVLRVVESLRPLERFPMAGRALTGRWDGFRMLVGPWKWILLVYVVLSEDRVVVVTVQDARTSISASTDS